MERGMGRGGGRQVKGVVKNNRVGCGGGSEVGGNRLFTPTTTTQSIVNFLVP